MEFHNPEEEEEEEYPPGRKKKLRPSRLQVSEWFGILNWNGYRREGKKSFFYSSSTDEALDSGTDIDGKGLLLLFQEALSLTKHWSLERILVEKDLLFLLFQKDESPVMTKH